MHAARGTHGALASGSEYADEAGMRIFFHGGNAVDAGVAAMFAAAVAEFSHVGMGGEAPILIRTKAGKVYAIAGVGTMPKLATAKFFMERRPRPGEILTLDPGGLKGIIPVAGIMPALVPGTVESGLVALRDFGTKSFSEEVEPAIELADGMAIDETALGRHRALAPFLRSVAGFEEDVPARRARADARRDFPPAQSRAHFAVDGGGRKESAGLWSFPRGRHRRRRRLFLSRRDRAPHRRIHASQRRSAAIRRHGGVQAEPEEPVSTEYHDYKVYKPGFWSQGPAMLETLNILEGYDLRSMGFNSAEYIHTVTEALKLAYADRDTYYGDPKFVKIPAEKLLSKAYAAERRKQIGHTASMDFLPGRSTESAASIPPKWRSRAPRSTTR